MSVVIQTSLGNIVIDLFINEAPTECENFIKLCLAKYYTFAPIYNIQKDLLLEFGDPCYPTSRNGESIWHLIDNSNPKHFKITQNKIHYNKKGMVGILHNDDQYATSIITILLSDINAKRANLKCIPFGQVMEGFEILDFFNKTILDDQNRPLQDIRIHHIYILDDPFPNPISLKIPSTPEPSQIQISTIRIDDLDIIPLDKELTDQDIKLQNVKDAQTKALTLEIIGDLPSADLKPMENVLFICKLNPLTTDDDLKIIFNKFGEIKSCEIIKDKSTGQSLQYAFIEYQNKSSCELAYFKMNDALIDDRRIHVDFSQSVAKLTNSWMKRRK